MLEAVKDFVGRNKWLVALGMLTALTLALGDTVVRTAAVLRPLHTTTVIYQRTEKKNAKVDEKIKRFPDGREEIERHTEDHGVLQDHSALADKETPNGGGPAQARWMVGAGYQPWGMRPYAEVGVNLGNFSVTAMSLVQVDFMLGVGVGAQYRF